MFSAFGFPCKTDLWQLSFPGSKIKKERIGSFEAGRGFTHTPLDLILI